MKTCDLIRQHIDTLRELVRAHAALDKARDANRDILPRRGIRGGRATTLEARNDRAAEYVERVQATAIKQACELWGLS